MSNFNGHPATRSICGELRANGRVRPLFTFFLGEPDWSFGFPVPQTGQWKVVGEVGP